jgi:putative transposase
MGEFSFLTPVKYASPLENAGEKVYRTRYFTDSGIIGTKEFVSEHYQRFKDVFMSKREKIPKPVSGLDGVYSLKRLAS